MIVSLFGGMYVQRKQKLTQYAGKHHEHGASTVCSGMENMLGAVAHNWYGKHIYDPR